MNEHRFTLILSGVSEITPELADALHADAGSGIMAAFGVPLTT